MELIIVTGLSGAGKSQALRCLEDMGFFCVDNLPCEMLSGFVRLCGEASPAVERAAVGIDSRESVFKSDFEAALEQIDKLPVRYYILYLECRDDVLVRRYHESRRRHPVDSDVTAGVRAERDMLGLFRDRADCIIDTSDLKPLELNAKLQAIYGGARSNGFELVLESFGYKRGVPFEADMVFDMRFSPNPFYEPELRDFSGRDAPVREFIEKDPAYPIFLNDVESMLDMLVPRFIQQGKRRLLVAFGCTGGRHRSVCAAEAMFARVKEKYAAKLIHRDARIEAEDITRRLGKRVDDNAGGGPGEQGGG